MSIPLDKLYHYIESIAQDIRGDDVVIYRFYPHGSKKLENLTPLRNRTIFEYTTNVPIYCNDQEPLAYEHYKLEANNNLPESKRILQKYKIPFPDFNFVRVPSIYDKYLLVHSEKRSKNVELYRNNYYLPVYYWSHAIISLDWFRYARYEQLEKNANKLFLVYNRAWSGTREYRLKFADLLITHNLINQCQISFNPIEPELGVHYSQYATQPDWQPINDLEHYISNRTTANSTASADYEIDDYNSTEFEVVLETLFDDERLHLTEKTLRPIAMGQPFLLAATHGSLEYLRSYGFRTFGSVIDESYDTIEDPVLRLEAIVNAMKTITEWTESEKAERLVLANQIAAYNRKHFFSSKFFNQVVDELANNLSESLAEQENTNTSEWHMTFRKIAVNIPELKEIVLARDTRANLVKTVQRARQYYKRILPKD